MQLKKPELAIPAGPLPRLEAFAPIPAHKAGEAPAKKYEEDTFRGRLTISVADFCGTLSVGKTSAFKLIRENQVDVVKIMGRTLVTVESVKALVERSLVKRGA